MAGAPLTPQTRYARNGSVYLAYQSFGAGDHEILMVPGFVSNVEVAWEHPPYRRFMERLASFARVTVLDKPAPAWRSRLCGWTRSSTIATSSSRCASRRS